MQEILGGGLELGVGRSRDGETACAGDGGGRIVMSPKADHYVGARFLKVATPDTGWNERIYDKFGTNGRVLLENTLLMNTPSEGANLKM